MLKKNPLALLFVVLLLMPFLPSACGSIIISDSRVSHSKYPISSFLRFEKIKFGEKDYSVGFGSAFIIQSNPGYSLAVTNSHVCNYAVEQEQMMSLKVEYLYFKQVRTYDNETYSDIEVLKYDDKKDLCLIKIHGLTGYPSVELSNTELEAGDDVYTIGSPGGFYLPKSSIVPIVKGSFIGDFIDDPDLGTGSMFNMIIYPGQSGSAIFDKNNKVIGVVSRVTTYVNISLSVRRQDLREFLSQ